MVRCIRDLELLPVRREGIAPLRRRIWGLRHNLTVYDAAEVPLGYLALLHRAVGAEAVPAPRRGTAAVMPAWLSN